MAKMSLFFLLTKRKLAANAKQIFNDNWIMVWAAVCKIKSITKTITIIIQVELVARFDIITCFVLENNKLMDYNPPKKI